MEMFKNYAKLLLIGTLLLSISACKKEVETPLTKIEISLPAAVSLSYGESQDIAIPANVLSASDVQIRLDFTETTNVPINASANLYDKLAQAVTVDQKAGKIHVNSSLLYPNSAVSSTNGNKIPESYKITITASSAQQNFEGKQTIEVKIKPATFEIKGVDNQTALPFAYVLYGDAANFDLVAPASILANTTWNVENKASLGTDVSFSLNQLKFSGTAGDPAKKAEKAYDVTPVLQKDGFSVASRSFRVVFIPQIKFFYGTYYSSLDITILLNNLQIALSNGYISAAPTLYPDKYKSTFSMTSIEKDGKAFDNTDGIFVIDIKTGSVTVKKNTTLTAGAYKITVKASTTTGLEFSTSLTLNMSKVE